MDGAHESTLLIIDDDRVALDTFARMLTAGGYRVVTTQTAESGLTEIEREEPGGLLLDLHLPITDGLEFLRQLRTSKRHADLRVAIVTGDYFMDEAVARELQALGARIYFKPIWEHDLARIARDLLGTDTPPDTTERPH
jgi:CheY-like chemotaxis protein